MILGRVNIICTPLALVRLTLSFGRSLRTCTWNYCSVMDTYLTCLGAYNTL